MYKKRGLILLVLIQFITYSSYSQDELCKFIEKLYDYHSQIELVESENNIKIDENTFNIKEYLEIFDKLSVDSCYNIGYMNFYGLEYGYPKIYAFHESINFDRMIEIEMRKLESFWDSVIEKDMDVLAKCDNPFLEMKIMHSIRDKKELDAKCTLYNILSTDSLTKAFLYLEPEISSEGYFQYLIFYIMGERFGFHGSRYFTFKHIICSHHDLKKILIKNKIQEGFNFNQEQANQLFNIDVSPIIEIYSEKCLITFLEFNRFGFHRKKYQISFDDYLTVKELNTELLVKNRIAYFY